MNAPGRLFAFVNDGILLIDSRMNIRDINPAAVRILDLDEKTCLGRPVDEVLAHLPGLVEVCRRPGTQPLEISIAGRFIRFSCSAIREENGNEAGELVLLEDVTDLRQAEESLRQLVVTAEKNQKDLQKNFTNLARLNEIAQLFNSTLDREWILQNAVDQAGDLTNSAVCCLFLLSSHGLTLSYTHPVEFFAKDSFTSPNNIDLERIQQLAQKAFEKGDTLPTNDLEAKDPSGAEPSAMSFPLKSGENRQGCLVFVAPRLDSFSKRDTLFGKLISNQLALVIENANLDHKVQTLSQTDNLTGLFTRRHYNFLAEHEFIFSTRYRRPLSAVMLDIDQFRIVNERYGRTNGDIVLQKIAKCIQSSLRAVDLIARYGGEEILILLPATGMDEACHVAERIRQQVEKLEISTGKGVVGVTISLGVTSIDLERDQSVDDLIRRADTALQDAKTSGRNRFSKRQVS